MKTLTGYELSQFLSLILRHKPETINIALDAYGYAKIDEITQNAKNIDLVITEDAIRNVVLYSDKKRFKVTGNSIKAIQGHSFEVNIDEQSQKPPDILYHGIRFKLKETVTQQGLLGTTGKLIPLYPNYYSAFIVENTNKKGPVVFEINAGEMYNDGYEFYLTDNNVWQTKTVPVKYMVIKSLNEIDRLKKIIITISSFFTKITNADIVLDPGFNRDPSIYVENCYLCNSKRALYWFYDGRLICNELTYERPAKSHRLLGRKTGFEQIQNEKEIILRSAFEIEIREDAELQISKNSLSHGIGIRFHCPHCNELNMAANGKKTGEEINCIVCNTPIFKIDKLTEIHQVAVPL
ncbi:RNA 2'-phosphotransferase [Chitinophaga ginsengisoli]|nr:RNA 2'-phosphotransferase [Chitinophaga ginsengisoli]